MYKFLSYLLIVIYFFNLNPAEALLSLKERTFYVKFIVADYAINKFILKESFKLAKVKFRKIGVIIKLRKIYYVKDFTSSLRAPEYFYTRFYKWINAYKNKRVKRKTFTMFIVTPIVNEFGGNLYGGLGYVCGEVGHNFSMIHAHYNIYRVALVMAHELGHNLGAIHDDYIIPSVMNSNASFTCAPNYNCDFSLESKKDIKYWLRFEKREGEI